MRTAAEPCITHRGPKSLQCINCRTDLCPLCTYYAINSRTWCTACAQQHLPRSGDAVRDTLLFLAKMAGLAVALFVPLLVLPGVMAKGLFAALTVGLYLRFVVFRTYGDSKLAIEEVTGGVKRTIET